VIGGGISEFNVQKAGDDKGQNPCFLLKAPDNEIIGGVIAATYWDWWNLKKYLSSSSMVKATSLYTSRAAWVKFPV
jgi:hypothetical protein